MQDGKTISEKSLNTDILFHIYKYPFKFFGEMSIEGFPYPRHLAPYATTMSPSVGTWTRINFCLSYGFTYVVLHVKRVK